MQLFWAIQNLFDEDPPVAPGGNVYPTNPVFFDTIGRRYRVGVRFEF
jgi:outer membrane receptor protein involved in Fe transport